MANEMGDTDDLLVKLSCGMDIVVIEGKFHFSCLTSYHNCYRRFLSSQCGSSESSAYTKKAISKQHITLWSTIHRKSAPQRRPSNIFSHENQATPPSLSDFGKIRIGRKSLLLSCLETTTNHPNQFDCKILDGAAVVHFLKTDTASTFADYSDKIFIPFIIQQLLEATRINIVWDCYLSRSIEGGTRGDKRGSGI